MTDETKLCSRVGTRGYRLFQGDSIETMARLPDQSVDLIFADPPYNLQIPKPIRRPDQTAVEPVTEAWDSFESFETYDTFTRAWLTQAYRLLKPEGALWVIGSYHNIFRVGKLVQDIGFWLLNDVIWLKSNPMPNFRGMRFTNAHETLLWCSRAKGAKYQFHYHSLKSFNDDLQMRSDWALPICSGKERLRDDQGHKIHPTQKPEALLYRVLVGTSSVGDLVLDPFLGSGTTGVVARRLRRQFIGIERDTTYLHHAEARIKEALPDAEDKWLDPIPSPRTEPRIPFGRLLESGLLKAGARLVSPDGRIQARVAADASVHSQGHRGSIHKVGAKLQGTESCNGWSWWQVQEGTKTIPLADLRRKLREEIPGYLLAAREKRPQNTLEK